MTREHVSLTIYNEGSSLVRERRRVELNAGINTLDITDVASQIDATSVTLQADGVSVLEQNYLYDMVGGDALLQRYMEKTIEITTEDGSQFTGELLSTEEPKTTYSNPSTTDIILRLESGQIFYASLDKIRDIRFPALPGGLMTRPTLRWLLHSDDVGEKTLELTYLTRGLRWTADYNLLLARDNSNFDLNGWVTLTNNSGASFDEAQVKLIAGKLHQIRPRERVSPGGQHVQRTRLFDPPVEQRELFEYQLYEIKRATTLVQNKTKQVEFIRQPDIPCNIFYLYYPLTGWKDLYHRVFETRSDSTGVNRLITTWLHFSTGGENGLGEDLPAGQLRVYQEDIDGAALLIGENRIDHTPKGEFVEFELGAAFDLVGERIQTDFQQPEENVISESYQIKLRNRKDTETVEIRVRETLFRWREWTIIEHSDDFTKVDAAHIEFRVPVTPNEERVITYTVHYRW